jgi:uncharacterized membrane protein
VPSETIEEPLGTGRIETFFDGVVAILITIMVLELKPRRSLLAGALGSGSRRVRAEARRLCAVVSGHRDHAVEPPHADAPGEPRDQRALLVERQSLVLDVLIPVSTAALGDTSLEPWAVAFYGAVLTANAVSFTLLHRCAACLGDEEGHLDALHRATIEKDWVFPTLYAASIPSAFVSVYVSMAIFLINPTAYFFPKFLPWPPSWQTPGPGARKPPRQG